MRRVRSLFLFVGLTGLLLAACGDDDTSVGSGEVAGGGDRPTVVATTTILGDVLENIAGDQVDVVTIMPVGADPHSFQASAQQANEMREADALIVNGAGFEEGLLDVIDAATDDGTPTFEAISAVEAVEYSDDGHSHDEEHSDEEHSDEEHSDEEHSDEEHSDEEHSDEEHSDEDHSGDDDDDDHGHGHDHEGEDPHFFTDPSRMAESADAMADFLIENVENVDADALRASADDYIGQLEALDADVEGLLADIPEEQRVLITNHEVFGYFADRYGFEVVGTVIPSGSTAAGASAGALADLAEVIEEEGVPAIFADTSSSNELADTLAEEVGGEVQVVELFSESLGDDASGGATYVEMIRANAERIAGALAA